MRLIGQPPLQAFPDAIVNIHPTLLPSFPGVDALAQALAHWVKVTAASANRVAAPHPIDICRSEESGGEAVR
jgi:phosphoribosylglycinamide formyltransferase 1